MSEETPKLIVDDDWKHQAQAEKERLAAEEAKKDEQSQGRQRGELPPADFRALVGTLASQALLYLGGIADPRTGQAMFEPEAAVHLIDLLAVLETKTKGNLEKEETDELAAVIQELRARFVELTRAVAAQQAQAAAGPAAQAPPPAAPPSSGGIITP